LLPSLLLTSNGEGPGVRLPRPLDDGRFTGIVTGTRKARELGDLMTPVGGRSVLPYLVKGRGHP
jgi:hypothetical protein